MIDWFHLGFDPISLLCFAFMCLQMPSPMASPQLFVNLPKRLTLKPNTPDKTVSIQCCSVTVFSLFHMQISFLKNGLYVTISLLNLLHSGFQPYNINKIVLRITTYHFPPYQLVNAMDILISHFTWLWNSRLLTTGTLFLGDSGHNSLFLPPL